MVDYVTANEFNINAMNFGKPIPHSTGTFRVPIHYNHANGTITAANIVTPQVFSFGVSGNAPLGEALSPTLDNVSNYTMPIVLFDVYTLSTL